MLIYLKENEYPMNLWIESVDAENEKEKEELEGTPTKSIQRKKKLGL